MTECRRIESLLPPYVDGEAHGERRRSGRGPPGARATPAARRWQRSGPCARSCGRGPRADARRRRPGSRTRIAASLAAGAPAPSLGWRGRLTAFAAAAAVLVVALGHRRSSSCRRDRTCCLRRSWRSITCAASSLAARPTRCGASRAMLERAVSRSATAGTCGCRRRIPRTRI